MPWKPTKGPNPYGAEHQALLKALLPQAIGKPCLLCGYPMREGQPLELHHLVNVADGGASGRKAIVHRVCNQRKGHRDAGKAAARQRRSRRTPRTMFGGEWRHDDQGRAWFERDTDRW